MRQNKAKWAKYIKQNISTNTTGCWIWAGCKTGNGYARAKYRHKDGRIEQRLNRIAYIIFKGEIPHKRIVMHTCDNTLCVNPSHLVAGTNKENSRDMVHKNRQARGETVGTAKLTATQVLEIRNRKYKWGEKKLHAKKLGITPEHLRDVLVRLVWKHV